jgi:transposase
VTPDTEARLRAASPAKRRQAIIDAHNEGASNRQIAAVVGMSEAGVRKIINAKETKP